MLPPGLRGFVAAQQQGQAQQAQELSMLAQLAQLKGAEEDRAMKRQLLPLQMQQQQGALAKLLAEAEQAKTKAAFFSPQNRQQYMEGARPEITLPADEQGPVSPAVPGKMNFNRFLQDAAANGVIPPETYANHLAQREQARVALEDRKQARADQIQARLLEIETRSQDRELDRQSREALSRESMQLRRELPALMAAMRPQRERMAYDSARGGVVNLDTGEFKPATQDGEAVGAKPTPEKAMPASAVKTLMENQQNLRRAEQALTLLQGGKGGDQNATGWKGMLANTEIGDLALQRLDPKGVNTRAAISDLGSMIIHDRSGAAVTAAEYPRLRPFIPKVTDDAATAQKKLERFVTEYRNVQQEAVDFFKESGYKVPENSLRPPPTSTPIGPAPQRRATDSASGWSIKPLPSKP